MIEEAARRSQNGRVRHEYAPMLWVFVIGNVFRYSVWLEILFSRRSSYKSLLLVNLATSINKAGLTYGWIWLNLYVGDSGYNYCVRST